MKIEITIKVYIVSDLCRHNDDKNFLVWVNEEDHMRIISMEMGGNIKRVFDRFTKGLDLVSDILCQQ